MEKAKVLEELIKKTGLSKKAFSEKCGIPYTTLYTILKKGVGGASVNTVISICKNLNITVEELEELSQNNQTTETSSIPPEIRSVARNIAELSEKEQETAKSFIEYLREKGEAAKNQ